MAHAIVGPPSLALALCQTDWSPRSDIKSRWCHFFKQIRSIHPNLHIWGTLHYAWVPELPDHHGENDWVRKISRWPFMVESIWADLWFFRFHNHGNYRFLQLLISQMGPRLALGCDNLAVRRDGYLVARVLRCIILLACYPRSLYRKFDNQSFQSERADIIWDNRASVLFNWVPNLSRRDRYRQAHYILRYF